MRRKKTEFKKLHARVENVWKEKVSKQMVWDYFSIYIRLRYANKKGVAKCYTCGKTFLIKDLQAGHAIMGRSNAVLFNEEIVRPQCQRCNVWLGGNLGVFVKNLIEENGIEWWEQKEKESKKAVKLDLMELYEKYRGSVDDLLITITNPNSLPERWKKHRELLI